jgi:hypothetical protein
MEASKEKVHYKLVLVSKARSDASFTFLSKVYKFDLT